LLTGPGIHQVNIAHAKLSGIVANNTNPADLIYEKMMIQSNIINAEKLHHVKKMHFQASSCNYKKHAMKNI
ncbi:NAD-dependent epimerase/dehydratase family protein, partial [Salmonella enterica]|uniref:NAD-dependent epimerase/dehydratase family protein n=1 Tax=Salmonella enterica TaxID=28901 RepID=UPI001F3B352E